ncbi:hypothetical protein H6768_01650 [Candidatus Peribacteria bacterium]|nr:hypothetical protein [Candidatus Peribacteria bacterium]
MRLISGLYTARLTRDVQRDILQLLGDEKSIQAPVLYVPAGDEHARTIWERLFTSLAIPKPEIREYPSPDGLNEHHI